MNTNSTNEADGGGSVPRTRTERLQTAVQRMVDVYDGSAVNDNQLERLVDWFGPQATFAFLLFAPGIDLDEDDLLEQYEARSVGTFANWNEARHACAERAKREGRETALSESEWARFMSLPEADDDGISDYLSALGFEAIEVGAKVHVFTGAA